MTEAIFWLVPVRVQELGFASVYFFCLIHWCALIGLWRFLRGERTATWETIRTPEFREHGGNTK